MRVRRNRLFLIPMAALRRRRLRDIQHPFRDLRHLTRRPRRQPLFHCNKKDDGDLGFPTTFSALIDNVAFVEHMPRLTAPGYEVRIEKTEDPAEI